MTPRKDWFLKLKHVNGGKVLMGNDEFCEVIGTGIIKFKLLNGSIKILEDVRLVPKLRRNLISLGLLVSNGCSYKFEKGILKIMKSALVIMKDRLVNDLYFRMVYGRGFNGP